MNKEDAIIGNMYTHFGRKEEFEFYKGAGLRHGWFEGEPGCFHSLEYEHMTPVIKPEFEIDEEIEVSEHPDFRDKIIVKFKHKDPHGWIYSANADGFVLMRRFARKIEPKVKICFCLEGAYVDISRELADKIKAGDV